MSAPAIEVPLVPDAVREGPGVLLIATDLAAVEPTNLSTAWSDDWVPAGPTIDGSEFSHTPSSEAIRFAEFDAAVKTVSTGSEDSVTFNLGLVTAANLKLAFSGGTAVTAAGITTFEPPAKAGVTRVKIGWQSDDGLERLIFRRCFQTGAVSLARRRGADVASLPMTFALEEPGGGLRLWKRITDDSLDA